MRRILSQVPIAQLLRFAIVGILTNLVGYTIYLIITYFGVEPKLAMTGLYIVGVIVSFFSHKKWTFLHKGKAHGPAVRFFVAHLIGYFINLAGLYIFYNKLGYPHEIVQAIAIFVVAGCLFIMMKLFVFTGGDRY